MAVWAAANLTTRMREVLESAAGTLRTITAGTLDGDLPPGLTPNEEARRALGVMTDVTGPPCESRIVSVRRSAASPPVIGNIALYDVEAEVRAVYPLTSEVKINDVVRDALGGLAAEHGETIAQAFTYPGNLTLTTGSKPTGLVSGMFAYVDSSYEWRGQVNDAGGVLEARHRFKGVVRTSPAVS